MTDIVTPPTHRSRCIALAAGSFVLLGTAHAAAGDNKAVFHSQVEVARFVVTSDNTKPGGAQVTVKRGAVIDATLSCRQDAYRASKLRDLTFPAPLKAVMRVKAPVRDTLGFPKTLVSETRAACERGDASIVLDDLVVVADCKEVKWTPALAPPLVFGPRLQATIECLGFSAPTEPKAALTAMTL
ncbi:MAG: hypothetical protein FJ096_22800, partial [Deltaproteobacteria bacterium]|nr:hypothetical protein [Deltaproteobacteria bacterium]